MSSDALDQETHQNLHYMGDEFASKYIIKRMQKSLLEVHNKGRMHFCLDICLGHGNYCIEEWHTSTPYDILWNEPTYPTVCLLLDMWHQTDHFITVCGKCIFDSNLKVASPLT